LKRKEKAKRGKWDCETEGKKQDCTGKSGVPKDNCVKYNKGFKWDCDKEKEKAKCETHNTIFAKRCKEHNEKVEEKIKRSIPPNKVEWNCDTNANDEWWCSSQSDPPWHGVSKSECIMHNKEVRWDCKKTNKTDEICAEHNTKFDEECKEHNEKVKRDKAGKSVAQDQYGDFVPGDDEKWDCDDVTIYGHDKYPKGTVDGPGSILFDDGSPTYNQCIEHNEKVKWDCVEEEEKEKCEEHNKKVEEKNDLFSKQFKEWTEGCEARFCREFYSKRKTKVSIECMFCKEVNSGPIKKSKADVEEFLIEKERKCNELNKKGGDQKMDCDGLGKGGVLKNT
jgi:hypothetical protein